MTERRAPTLTMKKPMTAFTTSTSNPFTPRVRGSMRERFMSKVFHEPNTGCWLWGGDGNGKYGNLSYRVDGHQHRKLAHRLSYELHVGPIPDGLVIDHKCRCTWCVNPSHLEPVTQFENVRRGAASGPRTLSKRKKTCAKGHLREGDNLVVLKDGGWRCRICMVEARRRHREKRVAGR